MKYVVIIALALAISGCQRAVPADVISAGNKMAMETAPGQSSEAPPSVKSQMNKILKLSPPRKPWKAMQSGLPPIGQNIL